MFRSLENQIGTSKLYIISEHNKVSLSGTLEESVMYWTVKM